MYTFDQNSGSTAQYETHSDSQVSSTSKPNKCKQNMLKQKGKVINLFSLSIYLIYTHTYTFIYSIYKHKRRGHCAFAALRMHLCVFTVSVMYEIISRLSETSMRVFPTGPLSNQCSSNRIHTTRLHLNTSLLSWLLNSLLLSLACTGSSAPICLSYLFPLSVPLPCLLQVPFFCHPVVPSPRPPLGPPFSKDGSSQLYPSWH